MSKINEMHARTQVINIQYTRYEECVEQVAKIIVSENTDTQNGAGKKQIAPEYCTSHLKHIP